MIKTNKLIFEMRSICRKTLQKCLLKAVCCVCRLYATFPDLNITKHFLIDYMIKITYFLPNILIREKIIDFIFDSSVHVCLVYKNNLRYFFSNNITYCNYNYQRNVVQLVHGLKESFVYSRKCSLL